MKFCNKDKELAYLRKINKDTKNASRMTIAGRRRIGKTKLIQKAYRKRVYLPVSRKNETLLCEEVTLWKICVEGICFDIFYDSLQLIDTIIYIFLSELKKYFFRNFFQ
jgi:hypothetical protein